MASPKIIPKKSTIAKVPNPSDLVSGEVAVNYADQQWYGKHPSTGAVVEIGAPYLHSHDQLLSADKNTELELNNSGQIVVTDNSSAKTFTLPSASGTIATLDDIVGSVAGVTSVNTRTGAVTLNKTDVGLDNVDNTSDANKPISTATQIALDGKAATAHTHTISATNGLQSALDTKIQKVAADATPVSTIRCLTQAEYDALGTYDSQTLYFIK